ncbi:MAG: hypothetical protein ABIF82_08005 [Planctomycetota bacterium]
MEIIKEYLDEIERLQDKAYTLMMKKFPVGSMVEYYQGTLLKREMVMSYAKNKCTLRVKTPDVPGAWVHWVSAVTCEPENSIEVRTVTAGSNACKIRIRKEKESKNEKYD